MGEGGVATTAKQMLGTHSTAGASCPGGPQVPKPAWGGWYWDLLQGPVPFGCLEKSKLTSKRTLEVSLSSDGSLTFCYQQGRENVKITDKMTV